MPRITTWISDEQSMYLTKLMRELELKQAVALRLLIDLGIARREETLDSSDLLRVSANTLTLLRRMASAADPQLIKQAKMDAEMLVESLKERKP